MNDHIKLRTADVPRAVREGYKGRKFWLEIKDKVTLHSTYWDGGTKSTWTAVNLATGQRSTPSPRAAAPREYGGRLEGAEIEIPLGVVIVEHAIFCGKDVGLTIYANAQDVAKFLPKRGG